MYILFEIILCVVDAILHKFQAMTEKTYFSVKKIAAHAVVVDGHG